MKPLTGPCHNCQQLGSIYYPEHDNYICAKHAAQLSIWNESKAHLLDLIAPTIEVWRDHWLERGLDQRNLEGTFENLETDLVDIVRDEPEAAR